MTCRVIVRLKTSVFDPQGSAIERSLKTLGIDSIESVRQGKIFDLTLREGLTRDEAHAEVQRIAKDILSNPVIESFQIDFT